MRIHAITPQKVTWNNMNETQKLVVGRCFKCFFFNYEYFQLGHLEC